MAVKYKREPVQPLFHEFCEMGVVPATIFACRQGREAGVGDVQELVNFIVERKIPAIFVESSVPRKKIEAVQEAAAHKGWAVSIGGELFSDAMGDTGTPEGTFIGMVRHNTDTVVSALLGETHD